MLRDAGYVDMQLNGYKGVDFNADGLAAEACHQACEKLYADGVAGILATIITDTLERMTARLARLVAIRRQDPLVAEVIWGIHIEGPFLNEAPGYAGAHPPDCIRTADLDALRRLLDAADGLTRLVTLCPNATPA